MRNKKTVRRPKSGVFAFIDSQNLNLAIRDAGWKLDYKKFRTFLKDKYRVEKAYLFIGFVEENKNLYSYLTEVGYALVFKPTLENREGVIKGNCDAELVLHAMIQYKNYSRAIVVSGDGDFHCLIDYLQTEGKLLKVGIPNKNKYSALLRKFGRFMFYVSELKQKLDYKKR